MYGVKKGLGSVNSFANTVSQQRILPAVCQGLFIVLLVALDNKIIKKTTMLLQRTCLPTAYRETIHTIVSGLSNASIRLCY